MSNSVFDAVKWADEEVDLCAFRDKRLGERLRTMLGQMAGAIGAPIPMASGLGKYQGSVPLFVE